jgi:Uma2 family endonuclease
MVQTPTKSTTLEEFLALPETKPASEYINGEIIQKPMPQTKHSLLQKKLLRAIDDVLEPEQIAMAFPELRCVFAGRAIVSDVAVVLWERIPIDENDDVENRFTNVPDWIIEIVSPDQSSTKLTKKILHGLKHGCQMGWLINPEDCSVFAYPSQQQPSFYDLDAPDELLPVPEFASGFQLTVGTLFSWLKKKAKK